MSPAWIACWFAFIILYAGRALSAPLYEGNPLAIGATGVLQRAYGGKGRDGIRETPAYEHGNFRLRMHS